MDKKIKILLLSIGISLLVAIASTSYAYFTISNKTGSEETITSGTMALTLTDGSKIEKNFMIPGEYIEKIFSVTNTGSVSTTYDIYLSEVVNTFVDKTDLVYELTSSDGGYSTSGQIQAPSVSAKIVDAQVIGANNTTHHYTLRITFLNKNEPQDDNQGVSFSGKIQINQYEDIGGAVASNICPTLVDTDLELTDDQVCNILTDNCDLTNLGNEVRIGNERFYVIGQEDANHVKLLTKNDIPFVYWGEDGNLKSYWSYKDSCNKNNLEYGVNCGFPIYGEDYPIYIYNEYSLLFNSVNSYVTSLKNMGINVTGRLLSYDEANNLLLNGMGQKIWNWNHYVLGDAYNETDIYAIGFNFIDDFAGYYKGWDINYDLSSCDWYEEFSEYADDIYISDICYDFVGTDNCNLSECEKSLREMLVPSSLDAVDIEYKTDRYGSSHGIDDYIRPLIILDTSSL